MILSSARLRPRRGIFPGMARRREVLTLKDRRPEVRRRAAEILCTRKVGGQTKYDPRVHPEGLIDHFREALEGLKEMTKVTTKNGDVKFVQKPVSPPLQAGYAAKIGVSRETLLNWQKANPEFAEAVRIVSAIQEQVFLEMGAKGAYNPRTVDLMMKNLLGWKDRVDNEHMGMVTLVFDDQDKSC